MGCCAPSTSTWKQVDEDEPLPNRPQNWKNEAFYNDQDLAKVKDIALQSKRISQGGYFPGDSLRTTEPQGAYFRGGSLQPGDQYGTPSAPPAY